MRSADRRFSSEARSGWRLLAGRLLVLLLALAMGLPQPGLAEDDAFHATTELVGMSDGASAEGALDPCVTFHLQCGAHQAIAVENDAPAPSRHLDRDAFHRLDPSFTSVLADALRKPPRL